jgi:xanthine dehydrogenase YagR molybdenum-binding subunit
MAARLLTAVAAQAVKRPVKLVLTRAQMFTSVGHRPSTAQKIILAADREGRLTGTEHHSLTTTSTVAHFSEPNGLSTRILYRSPHLAVSHRVARINAPTPCFMRGPGEVPGLFALEVAMDELAYSLHLDPLELRLRNHADIDQASGKAWSSKHPAGVLQGSVRSLWLATVFRLAGGCRQQHIRAGACRPASKAAQARIKCGRRTLTQPTKRQSDATRC